MTGSKTPTVIPAIRYARTTEAAQFLEKAFGFATHVSYPGEDGGIGHAEMTIGNGMVMFGAGAAKADNPWSKVPMGIYVIVPDADAHHARAQAAGAEIVMELYDTPYGSREYSARDPEGNLWSFGTYDPWATKAEG